MIFYSVTDDIGEEVKHRLIFKNLLRINLGERSIFTQQPSMVSVLLLEMVAAVVYHQWTVLLWIMKGHENLVSHIIPKMRENGKFEKKTSYT